MEVSAQGGDPHVLHEVAEDQGESDYHHVSALPGGKGFLYAIHDTTGYESIGVFDGSAEKELLRLPGQSLGNPVYSPTGHLLFQRLPGTPGIWAAPFSLSDLRVTGDPFLVASGAGVPSVAEDGTLIHALGPTFASGELTLLDRAGNVKERVGGEQAVFPNMKLSPDGRFVAARVAEADNRDIWLTDVVRGTRTRLTFADDADDYPAWSPDLERIYYIRGNSGTAFRIWMVPVDGSGTPVEITPGYMPSVSPDGRYLVYALQVEGNWQVYAAPLGPDGTLSGDPFPVVEGGGIDYWSQVSPDGRSLAYISEESGRAEVYLTRFPSGQGKWQVSIDGGHWPFWTKGGQELVYAERNRIVAVDVESEPTVRLGAPRVLFEHPPSGIGRAFDWPDGFHVTPDGETFVLIQPAQGAGEQEFRPGIIVVQNWIEEFGN
jgi:dipeptidyl aminopeptidase/acylaminoacyl peptidase